MDLRLTWIEIYELSHEWAKQVLQPWQHEHPVPNIHRVSNFFFISALDECYPKFNIHRVSNIFFISALDECYPKFITEYMSLSTLCTYYLFELVSSSESCHRLDRGAPPQKMKTQCPEIFGITNTTSITPQLNWGRSKYRNNTHSPTIADIATIVHSTDPNHNREKSITNKRWCLIRIDQSSPIIGIRHPALIGTIAIIGC